MSFVLGLVWYGFTACLTVAGLTVATIFLAFLVSMCLGLSYYGPYEAYGDAQWVFICLLIHDRFFGPTMKMVRNIYHRIKQAETEHEIAS